MCTECVVVSPAIGEIDLSEHHVVQYFKYIIGNTYLKYIHAFCILYFKYNFNTVFSILNAIVKIQNML